MVIFEVDQQSCSNRAQPAHLETTQPPAGNLGEVMTAGSAVLSSRNSHPRVSFPDRTAPTPLTWLPAGSPTFMSVDLQADFLFGVAFPRFSVITFPQPWQKEHQNLNHNPNKVISSAPGNHYFIMSPQINTQCGSGLNII